MKNGQELSREELEQKGWVEIANYGAGIIFGKGKDRILWIPLTNRIILDYTKD